MRTAKNVSLTRIIRTITAAKYTHIGSASARLKSSGV